MALVLVEGFRNLGWEQAELSHHFVGRVAFYSQGPDLYVSDDTESLPIDTRQQLPRVTDF
jgi:hypothetical protein